MMIRGLFAGLAISALALAAACGGGGDKGGDAKQGRQGHVVRSWYDDGKIARRGRLRIGTKFDEPELRSRDPGQW